MTGQRAHDDPPRLPLRVHSSELPGNGEDVAPGEVVVRPEDTGYEILYAHAAAAYRDSGIPMPYDGTATG